MKMRVIGICGRSGSGKGYVSAKFRLRGIPVIDTDGVYHELNRGVNGEMSDCTREIASAFPDARVVCPDGSLDRKALGDRVFSSADRAELDILNRIAHRHIYLKTVQLLEQYSAEGRRAAAIDAPLLFESGFDRLCDIKICVHAPDEIALKRITERDGISREKAVARLRKQIDYKTLCARCDYVIENDDILSVTAQVDDIIKKEGL